MNEKMKLNFDFYYGKDAEQFNFYRIPKLLFTDKRFKGLTTDAKVLYGLMLDRMSLSIKSGWIDDENRVYIYFTLEDVIDFLSVCKDKATKLFAELDDEKGVGLIKRKRQGLGKPMMVYVMNFNSSKVSDEEFSCINTGEIQTPEKQESEVLNETGVLSPEKQDTGLLKKSESCFLKNRSLESCNSDTNNTKYNNTDFNDNNHITSFQQGDVSDVIRYRELYQEIIAKNIEYDVIVQNYGENYANEILETILDAVCCRKDYLVISGSEIPQTVVKSRLLKLNYSHIEYVIDCLNENTTKIHNIKSYMITALYNSFTTIDSYYRTKVNYDLYGRI